MKCIKPMTNTMTVQYKTVNFNLTRTLISALDSIQQGTLIM